MESLYPHQEKAVSELHNGSILWGGVGSGKSKVAVAYYVKNEAPKKIYVITTAKKRESLDWQGEFAHYAIGMSKKDTVAGVLKIDSWNNMHKYVTVENAFFIFDEQRVVGRGAWVKAFLKIAKNNNWILLSATPGDTWLDYVPVFLANGFYKNITEFKQKHVVYCAYSKYPKVDRYVGSGKLVRLRNSILVEMPYIQHTTRHSKTVMVDYNAAAFDMVLKKRWNVFKDRPIKSSAEYYYTMRKVVNGDPSRLEAIKCLMEKHPKLIIFYNFDYELDLLRTLAESIGTKTNIEKISTTKNSGEKLNGNGSFVVAEWNGHKHENIPDTDRWIYLVQFVAGSEGWNCVSTDAMIFYSLTYSYKNWHQAHGRIDRLNTSFSDLYYYVLRSKSVIDTAVAKSLNNKKNFNESTFKGQYSQ